MLFSLFLSFLSKGSFFFSRVFYAHLHFIWIPINANMSIRFGNNHPTTTTNVRFSFHTSQYENLKGYIIDKKGIHVGYTNQPSKQIEAVRQYLFRVVTHCFEHLCRLYCCEERVTCIDPKKILYLHTPEPLSKDLYDFYAVFSPGFCFFTYLGNPVYLSLHQSPLDTRTPTVSNMARPKGRKRHTATLEWDDDDNDNNNEAAMIAYFVHALEMCYNL
jgi:hypothetical protein